MKYRSLVKKKHIENLPFKAIKTDFNGSYAENRMWMKRAYNGVQWRALVYAAFTLLRICLHIVNRLYE